MKKILLLLILLFPFKTILAIEMELNSKSAVLIEQTSGEVLFEKDKDTRLPMASMTKVMSMLLIMEQISSGTITYDSEVIISKDASDMGGSQVYLQTGDTYKVKDLLKSVAMASANDAIVALAEKTYGSVEEFVVNMNKKAESLGLKNTHFVNVHGLDTEDHYSSAYDMAIMAKELLKYEDILKFTSVYEDYLQKPDGSQIWLVNTNKLVRFYDGVDGLKTGYTVNAGYCLTSTAKKNNLRLISVVMGSNTIEQRSQDTVKLLNYGFNSYKVNVIKKKEESIGKIKVNKGKIKEIEVYLETDALDLLKTTSNSTAYNFNLSIDSITAPVKKNTVIGNVKIYDSENKLVNTINILVREDIKKANLWDYFKQNLRTITTLKK